MDRIQIGSAQSAFPVLAVDNLGGRDNGNVRQRGRKGGLMADPNDDGVHDFSPAGLDNRRMADGDGGGNAAVPGGSPE